MYVGLEELLFVFPVTAEWLSFKSLSTETLEDQKNNTKVVWGRWN